VTAALITAILLGIAGLGYTALLGYTTTGSPDILRHATAGTFFTLIVLLAHSMTMFYLLGKGKAVREAAEEGQLSGDFYATVARARRPVFGIATLAMLVTMAAAILGAAVDTDVLPAGIHGLTGLTALLANGLALKTELAAMLSSSRVVNEVNALLGGPR